ncbi:MAG TPA: peptide-methionine (S)-S-oxide reductase MsrA [Gaiellaceae bacterium]|nr:peptide-methionine (S)-S-oxide reductase MsrA [Gaiellaceae bacterium]
MSIADTSGRATFGAGCFWGVERAFRAVAGVLDAEVGYTGGTVESPSYWLVCSGATGHAEAVRVEFDRAQISYEELLDVFWGMHDPTRPRLGRRARYRSVIFVHSAAQERAARASLAERSGRPGQPVLTEIVPAGSFYRAEERHQRYLEKRGSVQSAASSRTN